MNISMDSKLLFTSSKSSSSSTPLSLLLSYQSSSFLVKPKFSLRTHVSIPTRNADKSSFLGQSLVIKENKLEFSKLRKTQFPSRLITAVIKRRKELPFDNVIQRDKKLKLVLKLRRILVNQPDRTMALRELGRFRRPLGLNRTRRFITVLKSFPGVFEIVEEGAYSLRFKLTPEAEELYLEELKVKNEMEGLLVTKIRKLLMMSLEKRIPLDKIAHLRTDLGLPMDFRDTICPKYPQYFKIVRTSRGIALELTHWDPELAISAAELSVEEQREREIEERNLIIDRPPKFKVVKLPKGLKLPRGEASRIKKFNEIPYISPYSDFSELKAGTSEKEKHGCAVVHEMLSLCIEKRTLVDHLTHFREEFRFSQQLRGMLIRHPDMFYVSLKGERDSVFLREAYHHSNLIEKDRLLIIKERMRSLVSIPRFRKRGQPWTDEGDENEDADGSEEGTEDEEDWSDIDGMLKDEEDDGDYDEDEHEDEDEDEGEDEDDWSDTDDETPPDFDDGDGSSSTEQRKPRKRVEKSRNDEDKVLLPVYPDGRPRERW